MKAINTLFKALDLVKRDGREKASKVEAELTKALEAQYSDWQALHKALGILDSEDGVEYEGREDGIYCFTRFDLSDVPEREREYLDSYLMNLCATPDWENECLMLYLGDDHYTIQDDTRMDNGVWQGHKLVIDESEYKDDDGDGDVNEEIRNELIEAHMEKEGCFPGVFRVTRYGDIYPVKTTKAGEAK